LRLSQGEKIDRYSTTHNNQISLLDEEYISRSESQGKTAVPIKVVNELSRPIQIVVESIDADYWTVFLLTLLNKPLLYSACQGLSFIEDNNVNLEIFRQRFSTETNSPMDLGAIRSSRITLTEIIQMLDHHSLLSRINNLDLKPDLEAELLGAYFYRTRSTANLGSWIEIYWMSIGMIALDLNVSPEALTIVCLTHELVHAYTHLGQDTDHEIWPTSYFDQSDLMIVEGLAQYYTEIICLKLSSRQPDTFVAFQELKKHQSSIYNAYSEWVDNSKKRSEMIRSVMIECRKQGITRYDDFLRVVEHTRRAL
jgi:hypothetical protein